MPDPKRFTLPKTEGTPLEAVFAGVAYHHSRCLENGEFRCFSSFLYSIAASFVAEESGVFAYRQKSIRLVRAIEVVASSKAARFESLIPLIIEKLNYNHQIPRRNQVDYIIELESKRRYVVLRRFWPPSGWFHNKEDEFFIYLVNPKAVIAPGGLDDNGLGVALGNLAASFIRWKGDIFARHEEHLAKVLERPEDIINEFRRLVVKPVLPSHFHHILCNFQPHNSDPYEWAGYIEKLREFCSKTDSCKKCLVGGANDGTSRPFECPQTPNIDKILSILSKLELWRTGFWKNGAREKSHQKKQCLDQALEGLQEACEALLWEDPDKRSPIDFDNGAVGMAGERALLRFFCAHAILESLEIYRKKWSNPDVHPTELEFPAHFASLASTLLGNGKWTPEAIRNLLQVVALYGHRVLRIPERVDLVRHLQQTLRGETALHTLKSRYRDHFFHTLEVCFLGFTFLTSRPDAAKNKTFGGLLLKHCQAHRSKLKNSNNLPPLPKDEKEFLAQWWTAALVHDTAYGIDIFGGTLKLLEFFTNRKEVEEFINKAQVTVKDMAVGLAKIATELDGDGSLKGGDHGVIAAASLAEVVKKMGPKTALRFLPSVRAVAFHNTRFPAVNAGIDPIAALLILCDTIQEWGRSSLGFDRSPSVLLSRMMEAASTPAEEQFGPVKRYRLSIRPRNNRRPSPYIWKKDNELIIELDYGEEMLKECRAKFMWADMTYNLQRVDFRPWKINLKIHVSIPAQKPKDSSAEADVAKSQFEFFGDFIEEQEVRFLENWFRTANEGDPKNSVCYQIVRRNLDSGAWKEVPLSEPGARELLIFDLARLGKNFCDENALMGGHTGNFYKAMTAWSVYLREQADASPIQRSPV